MGGAEGGLVDHWLFIVLAVLTGLSPYKHLLLVLSGHVCYGATPVCNSELLIHSTHVRGEIQHNHKHPQPLNSPDGIQFSKTGKIL